MSLFLSTFCNKLDKKGRVSVPASFRNALSHQSFQGIVAFRSFHSSSIQCCGMDRMEKLSQSMDPFYPSSSGPNWAPLFAEAQQLPFDGEGRISLPDLFCQHAELGETIAFVGQGPTFQIWNPSTFEAYQEASRQKLIQEQGTSYA